MSLRNPVSSGADYLGALLKDSADKNTLLVLPVLIFELVFLVIPMLVVIRYSFTAQAGGQFYVPGSWSVESYVEIVTSSLIHQAALYSIQLGLIVTTLAVSIGTFYAFVIWRSSGVRKLVLLFAAVFPILTTLVLRIYAWIPVLSPNGFINRVLLSVGVLQEPVRMLPGWVSTVVGQTYLTLPFVILSVYVVLVTIDWETVEAALDLGASSVTAVREVVIPQALPGIIVAAVLSFAWNAGAFTAPALLGPSGKQTLSMAIESNMLRNFNWSLGAALSIVMILLVLINLVILYWALSQVEGGGEIV